MYSSGCGRFLRSDIMNDADRETIAPQKRCSQVSAEQTLKGYRNRREEGDFAVGDVILDRYKVLALLGRGGMGIVYKCFDEIAGVEVAIKMLPAELADNASEMESFRENFRLMHDLHHPNIANLNQLAKDPQSGSYYLVMEYIQGVTLTEYMKNNNCSCIQKKKILLQIAETLDFVHHKMLVHRDIKPDNIMITADGSAKILDFGIAAKLADKVYPQGKEFCGSLFYIAPELWMKDQSAAVSSAVDRYALAVIVFEWTYGHHPFSNGTAEELQRNILQGNIAFPLKADLREKAVLKKALSTFPADRYMSCSEFIKAFFASPFYLTRKFVFAAAAVFAVCVCAAAVFFIKHADNNKVVVIQAPPADTAEKDVVNRKRSPRLLIRSEENIRNIKSERLSQGLLQELALSYGFQTINPEYVKSSDAYDFVIDVRFNGAYRLETFSFNKNLKLHAFSIGADMSATYPNGNLISQVTLPSQDFRIGKIGDPVEALRSCMHRRINSKEDVSFHNMMLQILERWCREIEQGMPISVTLRKSGDILDDIKVDVLGVLKSKNLLSDYIIRTQDADGNVTIDVSSKLQSMDIARLFVTLSGKKLKINSSVYGKIILERK